ncbi:Late embryogenesis abundant protein SMP subgroup domain-containing protein [Dioscorea alata]|uniref:Late embryogenesis abundant protein SMP subgroup domain-containing protein n=1 Tax=Dioscorea alata TaxID=55571 RepID=A0ACB7UXR7_DIOAL|nr:Late embryogenesis abundant protein SMP subgroup domain-containing protein [Dioscorea alata]
MSQQQPQRPQPINYGDVFQVSGDLAGQPIAPHDAAMMQSAETRVIGQALPHGPAAVMQSAANWNEQAGLLGHYDASSITTEQGVSVAETTLPGRRVYTEYVAGQVVGQYMSTDPAGDGGGMDTNITIGEALEVSAMVAGDEAVEQSDAAAIQATEASATGLNENLPGGDVAAEAQFAADDNERILSERDKTSLADVLTDASPKILADKAATREDAERVVGAELRNRPEMDARPGGVAASMVAAARLNEESRQ